MNKPKPTKTRREDPELAESDGGVNLALLIKKLTVEPETTLLAASEQAQLFESVARYHVAKLRAFRRAKARLEEGRASLSLQFRSNARSTGEKLTEANLDAMVTSCKEVRDLTEELNDAEAGSEYSKLLAEAYRMRDNTIGVIGRMAASGLASQAVARAVSAQLDEARENLRKKFPGGR
jgi:hypothetical protein